MSCVLVWAAVASASEYPETMSIGTSVAPKPHIIMLLVDVSVLLVHVCTHAMVQENVPRHASADCECMVVMRMQGRPGWSRGQRRVMNRSYSHSGTLAAARRPALG
jgi:hypothetical protein